MKTTFVEFNSMTIETFAKSYLAHAKAVQGMPVYHYEDFCQQPEAVLQQMCQQLKVNYEPIFTSRFSQFTHCTGDINFTGSSDYSKEAVILSSKVKKTPAYLKVEAIAACQQADDLLGHQGKE